MAKTEKYLGCSRLLDDMFRSKQVTAGHDQAPRVTFSRASSTYCNLGLTSLGRCIEEPMLHKVVRQDEYRMIYIYNSFIATVYRPSLGDLVEFQANEGLCHWSSEPLYFLEYSRRDGL